MTDIIQLLPENIANQIAAGEVIQRPGSAVKELLENAVDAGATNIELIVSDAGKNLIQVIDNGSGMSETDALRSFERHATSKIRQIEDLFHINTMGFRGEALASIAAVSQVVLRTRRAGDELGTSLLVENSKILKKEPCAAPVGTSFSMKNLFFNVPARRNFLRSNAVELRHIVEEFFRVAMAFPQLFFSFTNNGQQVFYLEPGTYKQRILQLIGNQYATRLVSVREDTDYLKIHGFVGKPETAKKTRGDQYFFVNNRFIRSSYLNHAVMRAFEELIPKDSYPFYILYIELDPATLDINVHPTKQEIKFEDEKIIYAFVLAAVKHALAQFSIAPSLDFTLNPDIQKLEAVNNPFTPEKQQTAVSSDLFKTFTQKNQAHFIEPGNKSVLKHWKDFFETGTPETSLPSEPNPVFPVHPARPGEEAPLFQLHHTYILYPLAGGIILLHQQLAHERFLYERFQKAIQGKQMPTQNSLFPVTIALAPADGALLQELLPELRVIGYQIEPVGNAAFLIQGTPADVLQGNEKDAIELLLEQYKHFTSDFKFSKREKIIRCIARQQAIKAGQPLGLKEMQTLVQDLFSCSTPNISPNGNPTYLEFKEDYLDRMFGR